VILPASGARKATALTLQRHCKARGNVINMIGSQFLFASISARRLTFEMPRAERYSCPHWRINMDERLLEKIGDHFIGLWRFRIYGVRRLWCVTLHVNGYYFDTRGKPTINEALKAAIKVVEKAKKRTKRIIR
jgi:hypothetical protein